MKDNTKIRVKWSLLGAFLTVLISLFILFGFVKDGIIKPNLDQAYASKKEHKVLVNTSKKEHKVLEEKINKIDKRVLVIETHYEDIKQMFYKIMLKEKGAK